MAIRRDYDDKLCRRRAIQAIIAMAKTKGKKVPTQKRIGETLGIAQSVVSYHMGKIKRVTPEIENRSRYPQ